MSIFRSAIDNTWGAISGQNTQAPPSTFSSFPFTAKQMLTGLTTTMIIWFLGTEGLQNILTFCIHTIGLINPVSTTFKLISMADDMGLSRTQHSGKRDHGNQHQHQHHQQQQNSQAQYKSCQNYLKFWVTYIVSVFLLRMFAPFLNILFPAQLFSNIFFIALLAQPEFIGGFVYDRIIGKFLNANVAYGDKIMSKLSTWVQFFYNKLSDLFPQYMGNIMESISPWVDRIDQHANDEGDITSATSPFPSLQDVSNNNITPLGHQAPMFTNGEYDIDIPTKHHEQHQQQKQKHHKALQSVLDDDRKTPVD